MSTATAKKKLGATENRGLTLDDVATYQIVLWMSVILFLMVFSSSIFLGNMGFKEDDAGL